MINIRGSICVNITSSGLENLSYKKKTTLNYLTLMSEVKVTYGAMHDGGKMGIIIHMPNIMGCIYIKKR